MPSPTEQAYERHAEKVRRKELREAEKLARAIEKRRRRRARRRPRLRVYETKDGWGAIVPPRPRDLLLMIAFWALLFAGVVGSRFDGSVWSPVSNVVWGLIAAVLVVGLGLSIWFDIPGCTSMDIHVLRDGRFLVSSLGGRRTVEHGQLQDLTVEVEYNWRNALIDLRWGSVFASGLGDADLATLRAAFKTHGVRWRTTRSAEDADPPSRPALSIDT